MKLPTFPLRRPLGYRIGFCMAVLPFVIAVLALIYEMLRFMYLRPDQVIPFLMIGAVVAMMYVGTHLMNKYQHRSEDE